MEHARRMVELVARIEADDRAGSDFRVLAEINDTESAVETVPGRFRPPSLEPDGLQPRTAAQAEATGAALFDALFSGSLRRVWARAVEGARRRLGGLRLVLRTDVVGVRLLPWELLYDRVLVQGHVALVDGWSVVRETGAGPLPTPPPHRFPDELQVAALVAGEMSEATARDVAVLSEAWPTGHLNVDVRVDLPMLAGSSAHLVHLVASAVPGADGWHSLALAPQPDRSNPAVSGAELAAALAGAPVTPEVLVLAAPETGLLAADLAATVPTVIGFRDQVSDAARLELARGFYLALSSGLTVEQAAAAGRSAARSAGRLPAEWAQPVVYTTPGQRLLPAPDVVALALPADPGMLDRGPTLAGPAGVAQVMARINRQALAARWAAVPPRLRPPIVERYQELFSVQADGAGRPGVPG